MLQQQTATSPLLRSAALKGLAAYQNAVRHDPPALPPPISHAGRTVLRDYGGNGRPVVFIPSLINPPFILDLTADRSLLGWLREQGHRCLLVDWGSPSPDARDEDLGSHVAQQLLPLIESLGESPVLVGYCLGGTLALAAAQLTRVAAVATIAAPWKFSGYGAGARAAIAKLWGQARATCDRLGLVPMEVLQTGFWKLDPERTVAKYAKFGTLDPDGDAARCFIALEDWANAGAPLTLGVGRDLFDRFIAADDPGNGNWSIEGMVIDPAALQCPSVEFISATDRIVPSASAAGLSDARMLQAGHVGMIVGGRGREQLWQPLSDWISSVQAPR